MVASIYETYQARTTASAAIHSRTQQVVPGGTSRQAGYWSPYPLAIDRGEGIYLWDIDGHRYLDLINNYTSMVHGHAYPPVLEATKQAIKRSTGWAAANKYQCSLAEQLVERVPATEQVRFTNSGTESAALSLNIARTVTGRNRLLMARYGYHGSLPEFETGSSGNEGPITYLAGFNNLEEFETILESHGHEIAAVFLEPVLGSGGVKTASKAFLLGVEKAARKAGALFVLDEVLTFRFAPGGSQTEQGLKPDLTMFGKLIGGGFPVGAVGGEKGLLSVFDPVDMRIFHTGTFNANPVTMAAGDVSVRELTAPRIAHMAELCSKLRDGLTVLAADCGLPLSISHHESCLNLYFSDSVPESSTVREDQEIITRFHLAALNHGLFLAPRGMMALSTITTQEHIDEVLELTSLAMKDVATELQR